MRPTSAELLDRIVEALDLTVLPAIADDKWAASVLRSATTLLRHLAKRVDLEIPFLLADNEDAHAILTAIAAEDAIRAIYPELAEALAVPPDKTPDVACLDERNRTYQAMIERLLRGLHGTAVAESARTKCRVTLRQYLARRRDRERDIYFPAFTGPPF